MIKSLTPAQEKKACEYFKSKAPEDMTGADVGILLMLSCGLRAGETLLASYEDIDYDKDLYGRDTNSYIKVYRTVEDKVNKYKSRTKICMDRQVILPDLTAEILEQRYTNLAGKLTKDPRKYLLRCVDYPEELLPLVLSPANDVEKLKKALLKNGETQAETSGNRKEEAHFDLHIPMVSEEDDFMRPLSPEKLLKAARKFLLDIGINEEQLQEVEDNIQDIEAGEDPVSGKNAPAYIFRANLGTIMMIAEDFFRYKSNNQMANIVSTAMLGLEKKRDIRRILKERYFAPDVLWICEQVLVRVRPILNELYCEHCGKVINESFLSMVNHHGTLEPNKLHPKMTCPHCNKVLNYFEFLGKGRDDYHYTSSSEYMQS